MDWRARRYYLVSFSWESYQMRIDNIKRIGAKQLLIKIYQSNLTKSRSEIFINL